MAIIMPSGPVAWTNTQSLKLIELYHSHRELWDPLDDSYKDRYKKREAWHRISQELGEETHEVERKMKNLTCHFHREYTKETKSKFRKPDAAKWFAYDALRFLKEKNRSKNMANGKITEDLNSATTVGDGIIEASSSSAPDRQLFQPKIIVKTGHEQIMQADGKRKIENRLRNEFVQLSGTGGQKFRSQQQSESSSVATYRKSFTTVSGRKRALSDEDGGGGGHFGDGGAVISSTHSAAAGHSYGGSSTAAAAAELRDEFTVFGEQVAFKMRKLQTDYARAMVEHIINTTLFEAQLGKYNAPETTQNAAAAAYATPYVTVHSVGGGTYNPHTPSTCTSQPQSPDDDQENEEEQVDEVIQFEIQ